MHSKSTMIKVEPVVYKYTHQVDIHHIDPDYHRLIYDVAMECEYDVHDYHDGDYWLAVSFIKPPYGISNDEALTEAWDDFMTYLQANIPADIVKENKLAIRVTQ